MASPQLAAPSRARGGLRLARAWGLLGVAVLALSSVALVESLPAGGRSRVTGGQAGPGDPRLAGASEDVAAAPTGAGTGGASAPEQSVVRLSARTCDGFSHGSGVLLGDGRVLTAHHVVEGSGAVLVARGEVAARAVVIAVDRRRDAALLELEDREVMGASAGGVQPASAPDRGELVAVSGHAAGGLARTRLGQIIAYTGAPPLALDGGPVMAVDVGLHDGDSGGPVLDASGALVAVAIGTERVTSTGIAVPIDELGPLLSGLGGPPRAGCPRPR